MALKLLCHVYKRSTGGKTEGFTGHLLHTLDADEIPQDLDELASTIAEAIARDHMGRFYSPEDAFAISVVIMQIIFDDSSNKESGEDSVTTLEFSNKDRRTRIQNCLRNANINRISDLEKLSRRELLLIRNFGKTLADEIETALRKRGRFLADAHP